MIGFPTDSLADTQRILLVTLAVVAIVIVFSGGIAAALVRRSVRARVDAERLAAMGTATARILHQVKNPLQSLILHAEMLNEDFTVTDAERRAEVTGAILEEATRIAQMLQDLSAYASGVQRRIQVEPVDLRAIVEEVARSEAREAEREGIAWAAGPSDEAVIAGDPYFLRQALENVLRNAREAVASEPPGHRRLELSLRRKAGHAVVVVRDSGPGIETARVHSVVEPFYTTKPRGMGLGLPICREIVEAHGGRLDLRSKPAAGTTVRLIFPLHKAKRPLQPA